MRIPIIKGIIRRRMLINFRADVATVQRLLPAPFRPKTHRGFAIVGVCLIRLEQIRPRGLPGALGISSENAAHRMAVEWDDEGGIKREGVYIPRRDSGSLLNQLAGGRVFPGEHQAAKFCVKEAHGQIDFAMRSTDGETKVTVLGDDSEDFPADSCFRSLQEASAFFEGGSLGYSARQGDDGLDGMTLKTLEWKVRALKVSKFESSYFADRKRFPEGTVQFDHALIMRNVVHEWHQAEGLRAAAK